MHYIKIEKKPKTSEAQIKAMKNYYSKKSSSVCETQKKYYERMKQNPEWVEKQRQISKENYNKKKLSNFYLDIFNKLLSINEHKIFIVFDKNENIWFYLRDLLLALGYKDTKDAIRSLDIDDEFTINIGKLLVGALIPVFIFFNKG
jgi:hypothetical protein